MLNVKLIKKEMKKQGVDWPELAKYLGTTVQHLEYILIVAKSCSLKNLCKFSKRLDIPIDELVICKEKKKWIL